MGLNFSRIGSLVHHFGGNKLAQNIGKAPTTPPSKGTSAGLFLTIEGLRCLSLKDIAPLLKCCISSDNGKGFAKMTKGRATAQFTAGEDYITYQTSKIYLSHKLKLSSKKIFVSYDDYFKILVPLLAITLIPEKNPTLKTIVINPGHGGKDSGQPIQAESFWKK
jgi:N-acetylmuramoyl-L-alanine amidase